MKKVIKDRGTAWRETADEASFKYCRMRGTEGLYRRLLRQHRKFQGVLPLRRL